MFESGVFGSGTLAPVARRSTGKLRDVRSATSQRATSVAAALPDAASADDELSAVDASALKNYRAQWRAAFGFHY